jgi:hypothetical protein
LPCRVLSLVSFCFDLHIISLSSFSLYFTLAFFLHLNVQRSLPVIVNRDSIFSFIFSPQAVV